MNMRWDWHVAFIQDSTNAFKICFREHKGKLTIQKTYAQAAEKLNMVWRHGQNSTGSGEGPVASSINMVMNFQTT